MNRWIVLGAAAATVLGLPRDVSGQAVPPGARVRVSYDCAPSCQVFRGTVGAVTPDTIVIRVDGETHSLFRGAIRSLEVRTRPNRRLVGGVVGFLLGSAAGLGVTVIGASASDCTGDFGCWGWLAAVPAGALVGTFVGIGVGGGAKWESVPVRGPVVARRGPAPLRVHVRLRF